MGQSYTATPQEEYENSLREMDDPSEPDTNMDFATGNKLFTMKKREEYDLLIESLGEADDGHLENAMECIRAALIDNSTSFDAAIGAIVREQFTRYMRPTITKDHTEYMQRMHDNLIDDQAYQADCIITQRKEEAQMRKAA